MRLFNPQSNPGVGPLLLSLNAVTDPRSYPNLYGPPSPAPMVGVPGPPLPNPQAFEATGYYPMIYNPPPGPASYGGTAGCEEECAGVQDPNEWLDCIAKCGAKGTLPLPPPVPQRWTGGARDTGGARAGRPWPPRPKPKPPQGPPRSAGKRPLGVTRARRGVSGDVIAGDHAFGCPPDCGYGRVCRNGRCVPVHPSEHVSERRPNTDVWWGGGGIAPWSWRPRSAPAVGISPTVGPAPWGAFQYQGGFWPWNGTAPYPGRYRNPARAPHGTPTLRFTIHNPASGNVHIPSRGAGPQLPTGQWMRPAYNPFGDGFESGDTGTWARARAPKMRTRLRNATLLLPSFHVQGSAPRTRRPIRNTHPLPAPTEFCQEPSCPEGKKCTAKCTKIPKGATAPRAGYQRASLQGAPKFRNRNRGVAQARARLSNPPPVYPGPGAHSQFAPLPPQWFYYTSPSTAGAPQAPGIQVAAPGPPPGVFGQGGRCYNDRDCRDNEYCHGGICLPKPWSGQQQGIIESNPGYVRLGRTTPPRADRDSWAYLLQANPRGRQVGAQEWAMGLAPNPGQTHMLVTQPQMPSTGAPARRGLRRRNPEGMVSMTQPLAPGFQLR